MREGILRSSVWSGSLVNCYLRPGLASRQGASGSASGSAFPGEGGRLGSPLAADAGILLILAGITGPRLLY
jgi:hypothetical protein